MKSITVGNYRSDRYYTTIVNVTRQLLLNNNSVSSLDLFVGMGLLEALHVQRWRKGQVPYLENVVKCNLVKANRILRIFRMHAHDLGLGRRLNGPAKWKGKVLRFSKSGERALEEAYSQVFYVTGSHEKFVRRFSGTERRKVPDGGAITANSAKS